MIKDYKNKSYNFKTKKFESIHPEIGELREKFMYKDFKIFKNFNVKHFLRAPYENEIESYEKNLIKQSCKGEECVAMNCILLSSETRAIIPMNQDMFTDCVFKDKTPVYYKKQMYIGSKDFFEKNIKKGFKNEK